MPSVLKVRIHVGAARRTTPPTKDENTYWSRQEILELIELYSEHECLWNVKSKKYKNRHKRAAALNDISMRISRSDSS